MLEPVNERLGNYELVARIAHGGMAEVFLARRTGVMGFEKFLVIKRILPHLATEPQFVNMFLDEARIAANINHPNVVQIYDLGQQDGSYFIAMEYVDGESLASVINRGCAIGYPVPIPLAARIISEAAAGLHFAHELKDTAGRPLGIVHRDVSPQNILVLYDGGVKLVDFGVSKARNKLAVTVSGALKGKYAYMSPEQSRGEEVDRRSDVFSLGVILWESLTARRLYKNPSELMTLKLINEQQPPPPSSFNPKVAEDLDRITTKALAKKPDERYATAQELHIDLERYLQSQPETAGMVEISKYMQACFTDRLAHRRRFQERLAAGRDAGELGDFSDSTPSEVSFQLPTVASTPTGRLPLPSRRILLPEAKKLGEGSDSLAHAIGEVLEAGGRAAAARRVRRRRWPAAVAAIALLALGGGGGALYVLYRSGQLGTGGGGAGGASGAKADAAAPAPKRGSLKISSTPSRAEVFLDGRGPLGSTPLRIDRIDLGAHRVEVRLDGHEAWLAPFSLEDPGAVTVLYAVLTPLPAKMARLNVRSRPPGATVEMNGKALGKTPLELTAVQPDKEHRLVLSLKDRRLERTLRLAAGETLTIDEALPPASGPKPPAGAFGSLTIETKPWTSVYLGRRLLGDTPLVRKKLPAGTHTLTLVNEKAGIRRTVEVTIRKGVTTRKKLKL